MGSRLFDDIIGPTRRCLPVDEHSLENCQTSHFEVAKSATFARQIAVGRKPAGQMDMDMEVAPEGTAMSFAGRPVGSRTGRPLNRRSPDQTRAIYAVSL